MIYIAGDVDSWGKGRSSMKIISIRDGAMYKSAPCEDWCRWTGHIGLLSWSMECKFWFEGSILIIDSRFWDDSFHPLANLKRLKFIKEPII